MTVPHLPWKPSETSRAVVVDGPFSVDGLETFQFSRKNHRFGGHDVFGICGKCGDEVKAGGHAGEKRIIRWAWAHSCNKPSGAIIEGEEDKNLFRD